MKTNNNSGKGLHGVSLVLWQGDRNGGVTYCMGYATVKVPTMDEASIIEAVVAKINAVDWKSLWPGRAKTYEVGWVTIGSPGVPITEAAYKIFLPNRSTKIPYLQTASSEQFVAHISSALKAA